MPISTTTDEDGFFVTPLSQDDERATSARCYLDAQVRARANLEIMCDTRVLRVALDGARAAGVVVEQGGGEKTIAARAGRGFGGCHSFAGAAAALGHRSGRRSAQARYRGRGRPARRRAQLPKSSAAAFRHDAQAQRADVRGRAALHHDEPTVFFRPSSAAPRGDLFHYYTGRVSTRSFGPRMAMLAACLYTPVSRGSWRCAPPTRTRRFVSNSGFSPIRSMPSA